MTLTKLKISEEDALAMYPTADPFQKAVLEASFGKDFFTPKSIIERVNSMQDLFDIASTTVEALTGPHDTEDDIAYKVIKMGIRVMNEGKVPDHSDSNQVKYEPRFYDNGSGLGLSYGGYDDWDTTTYVGPRLCYLNKDNMMHGLKIMKDYYHTFYNLKK